jgi:ubiquinone/menaquinone biosynthesis C-methylase UbiE
MLTESAYADDRNLRSRMAIWAYAEEPPDPAWRTSSVAWDGTQVVLDAGCGNGFDLRQLIAHRRCGPVVGMDLSAGMLRSVRDVGEQGRVSLVQADLQRCPLRAASVDVGLAMHMLYHVPDVPAAVRELRRVVKPGGVVLASTNSGSSMSEIHRLFDAVISELAGEPVTAMPSLSFSTESGQAMLAAEFSEVELFRQEHSLSIPDPEPVVRYLDSVRAPILSHAGRQFDFDAALAMLADRVAAVIQEVGTFRATSCSGVFACR